MKTQDPRDQTAGKPRFSLEQKIRLLARKFRTAERRRKRKDKEICRSMRFSIRTWELAAVVFLSAALSFTAQAATTSPTFEQANTTFASGNYRAAIAQYDAILAQDGYSAPVLFNLGNACYRAGQFGEAILDYERAQVLAPHDSSIAANLQLAREKAGVPAPALNELERAVRILSPNELAWTGNISLIAICLAIGISRFFPRFYYGKAIAGIGIVLLMSVAVSFAIRWPEFGRAIVVAANAPARIAPASTAAESFALKAGEPVAIARNYGEFILARTHDGRAGWVNENEIGRVHAPGRVIGKQNET